jgi:hypothetical protein
MTQEVIQLLIQLPVVGIFAWFVWAWSTKNQKAQDERDKIMQQFWMEQRESDRGILERLVLSVDGLCDKFGEHDQKTASALAVLRDREATKQRAVKRTT